MRRSIPIVIAVVVLSACATTRPVKTAAQCEHEQKVEAQWEALEGVTLDPNQTFGPSEVLIVHPREADLACLQHRVDG